LTTIAMFFPFQRSRTILLWFGLVAVAQSSLSSEPVTRAELMTEIQAKLQRVRDFLVQQQLAGVLLSRVDNFSWVTAGIADNHIVITSEVGAASLLVMRDGRKFVLANNSEMPRLLREDLTALGYEPKSYPWYDEKRARLEAVAEIAHGRPVGTDVPDGHLRAVGDGFASLRYQLTDSEIKKYRSVGRSASEAVAAVCRTLSPGVSEREMEAMASSELMRRGLRPTVLLMGVDHRVYDYHHHSPTDLRLSKYAIVNVCARRWGLVASVARFVHFGPLEPELKSKLQAAMLISAKYEAHSKPGVTAGQMIDWAKTWFAGAGFPGLWQDHHQGGAIGYAEREWLAVPGSKEVIHDHQAFAWNPIIRGALSFDTIIVYPDHVENITQIPDWPTVPVEVDGVKYPMPDILIR
jgi:Xaa-Pro dipeptidase